MKSIHANPSKEYKCKFCNKIWITTLSMYHQHEKHCFSNPDRTPWRQEINPYHHTDESRNKISQKQKENYLNGRSRWHIDRSQDSYAEKYFMDWLSTFTEYKHNYWTNRFYLDFAWPDKMIYIEVNGEQHYQKDMNSKDYQVRDKERYNILEKEGWKCISIIRWSWFKSLSSENKISYLKDLKEAILSSKKLDVVYMSEKEKRELLHNKKLERAKALNKIDSKGRICNKKILDTDLENLAQKLKESDIDFLKFGWAKKAMELTGESRKTINRAINYANIEVFRQGHFKT